MGGLYVIRGCQLSGSNSSSLESVYLQSSVLVLVLHMNELCLACHFICLVGWIWFAVVIYKNIIYLPK